MQSKYQMHNQPTDINDQIDRILSSNIRQQLLSNLPLQLLQSPVILKSNKNQCPSSVSQKCSEKKSQMDEDLYEKAEQIFKLKEILQNELANINQIVMENQKLTEANQFLNSQLSKVKNQWRQFKSIVSNQMRKQLDSLKRYQSQQIDKFRLQWHQNYNKNIQHKRDKLIIISCHEINRKSIQIQKTKLKKQKKFRIQSSCAFAFIEPCKLIDSEKFLQSSVQTQIDLHQLEFIKQLQLQISDLNSTVSSLKAQNTENLEAIRKLQKQKRKQTSNRKDVFQQKIINHQQKPLQKYSSIFMKSIFQSQEDIDQIIKNSLYGSQKSIFDQLEEGKYFGKIVLRSKNGNAIEQYKNGFQYQGRFLKNKRHGLGKLFYKKKLIYAGQWKQGRFQGKGIIFYYLNLNVQKIQANFMKGVLHGYGLITFKSGKKVRALFKSNIISSQSMALVNKNHQNSSKIGSNSRFNSVTYPEGKENQQKNDGLLFKRKLGESIRIN